MGRKPKVNIQIIQDINKLYNRGYNMKQLGEKFKLSPTTVNKYVWEPRNRGERVT
ncbi:helix-turn-helix domain-containing protein [Clostridium peptidivorans]|uniref:helix-turn-helix domain-containing protein n=1 Tax=Clostridium peptidivorans TaxID=100174 RepID=UPI0011778CCA|nr:helix-turn-helix domain-containing protein [Clostridium peptidivorans]